MEKKSFYVLMWDFNNDMIEHYDVLPYFRNRIDEQDKKKSPKTIEEFKQFVKDESMYQFWSRCEYEMIIHGWPMKKNNYKIDVHEQIMMNLDIIAEVLYNEYLK